jgi:uncharacterized OsmC-like protein
MLAEHGDRGRRSSASKIGSKTVLEYRVTAKRKDRHGSEATTKQASIILDTDVDGRSDAFNPAELLLASLAACIIKGIERAIPMIKFELRGVEVAIHGIRQDSPPKMLSIEYDLVVDTEETDHRLELLHTNVRKYGTVSNTLAAAVELKGNIKRKS